jgi:hypothetical protein
MLYATKQGVQVPSFPDFTDNFNMFFILMQQPLSQALENEEVILPKRLSTIHYFRHSCRKKIIQIC